MQIITQVIDKSFDYFYFLFKQKLLFFITFFVVGLIFLYNQYNIRTAHYGEVEVFEGGHYYVSKLNSFQQRIVSLRKLKIDFLTNANIGFGIKESKFDDPISNISLDQFKEKLGSIILDQPIIDEGMTLMSIDEFDTLKYAINTSVVLSQYFSLAFRNKNQSAFLKNFFEDAELLKKYGLTNDPANDPEIFFENTSSFGVDFYPFDINKKNDVRKLIIGFKSYDKKYILPVLIEYNKYINNLVNQDIEKKIKSFVDSNIQMIFFQKELLKKQLKILEETYDVLVEDEINKLKENLLIAKALGFQKSYFHNEKAHDNQYVAHCLTGKTTLYCLGYEALQTKIDSLQRRNDPIPYIQGYREIQSTLKQLEDATISLIAASSTFEYDFDGYKEYVMFDQHGIHYSWLKRKLNINLAIVISGIIFFLLFSLIKKIYTDEKKLIMKL